MALAPSVLLSALLAACGGDAGRPATWVPPCAERSVERLPAAQRAAGMALLRLERAARAGDAEELCGSVYRFQTRVPIPRAECERGLKDAFAPDGLSIDVRAIRFTGADRAVATAATVETDGKGV